MHRNLLVTLAVVALLVIGVGLFHLLRDDPSATGHMAGTSGELLPAANRGESPASTITSGIDPAVDIGKARFETVNDRELLSPEFLDVFNRFLFEYHQQPRSELLRNFDRWLARNYSEAEARRIREIFLKYLDYVDRMQSPGFFSGAASLRDQSEKMRRLRREIFGQELADILFRDEEKSVDYALSVRELQQDRTLDFQTRKERMDELARDLPPHLREVILYRDPRQKFLEEQQQIAVDLEGLSEQEKNEKIRDLRLKHFGPEATERLERLDQEIVARSGRYAGYDAARNAFLADPATASLSREEKDARLQQLRQQNLNPLEAEEMAVRETLGAATSEQVIQWMEALRQNPPPPVE
ncbi:MAG: hypothetical protein KIT79_00635 [Deltaproteobacteria bacterium]|nr:hypothetical protein [Deltaproteobacteria bacterium]